MTFTIGKLAHKFNLSRSTLLYYDSIGLLSPAGRGNSNYRIYSESDCKRLEQIAIYRQAGLSLQQIKEILDSKKCNAAVSLEAKIDEINEEINTLRQQQHFIIEFLQNSKLLQRIGIIPKDDLVELLHSAGIDETGQWKLHNQFENKFPERHEAFLQLLGLKSSQISKIREWARREQK
ncbi:hypothetical protein SRRS_35230 [Sporomusa rhizae]|uniref:MerR family transcriptional regulator n=1 Tax=Sporomusa rhizae TaxID=357999 RepID=UPI00352A8E26